MTTTMARWCRRNLFAKPFDTALSIVSIPLCAWILYEVAAWAIAIARWEVIPDSLKVMMVGIYPAEALWRAWVAVAILSILFGATLGTVLPLRARTAVMVIALSALLAVLLARSDAPNAACLLAIGLSAVAGWAATSQWRRARQGVLYAWIAGLVVVFAILSPPGAESWGGLLLSVLLTIVASILTIPLGVLLAFGRRNRFASVRVCCTAYIEVMRSVPLILIVYWVWIIAPLLSPEFSIADVLRGMAGFVLFFSAYVAEYVRSGLQSVPRGQVEAARSLGLSAFDVNYQIVLPQAIRVVVPALVGNVLDIFNAAPLVFIIGLTDFLRTGQMVLANPQYSGRTYEIYSFLLVTYFVIGSLITFAARRLEGQLGRGAR